MPIHASTEQNPRVIGKTISGVGVAFGPGTKVSLNFTKRSFLVTPRKELCLTEANPTGIIPLDVDEAVLAALKIALDREEIVIGHQPIRRVMRKGLLEPIYQEIDQAETVEQVKQTVYAIASGRKRLDGHPPSETVRCLALHEASAGCRQNFLDFFGDILERVPGPSGVEEHAQDRVQTLVRRTESGGGTTQTQQRSPEQQRALRDLI